MTYSETIDNLYGFPDGRYYGLWGGHRITIMINDKESELFVSRSVRGDNTRVTVVVDKNLIDIYCGWS